jgi:hypothetical protein
MTWKQKQSSNFKLIALYMASLELETLTYDQRLNLATEIGRLHTENQKIDNMLVQDYVKDCMVFNLKQQSIING